MGYTKRLAVYALIALLGTAACPCMSAPVKSSDYPWINTNAIEYLQPTDAVAVQDAHHFDSALSPERLSAVKTERPGKQCLKYQIWRDTYVNDWAAFERQKQQTWARNNGKNAEDFWCHFANDVTVSLSTGAKTTPGWDPANDANGDDIRDYKSDYGRSTGAGAGYLQDSSKNWAANEWAGHILVDRAGNQFTITGNSATQINVSGTPASGRYGVSHSSSANHRATAKTRPEARVRVHAWGDASFPDAWVQNYASVDYRAYRRYDVQQILSGNTSWDPGADSRWDGIFVDSTLPYYDWPVVADGADRVVEYPNKDAAIYRQHTIEVMAYVKAGTGSKVICPNTCGIFSEAGDAGGAEYQENTVSFNSAQGPYKWDNWRARNAKGVYCFTAYFFSYSDRAREQLHFLAHHYIAQEPYIYFGVYGFGYTPVQWFAAIERDVGTPVETYSLWKSGTDPVGQAYNVYKRQYTKALILCRPMHPSGASNFGDSSRVTFTLPSYTTTDGGTSNRYYSLRSDGTLSAAVTSIGLRNVESAILLPADTASPPPPPTPDTTPPTISSVAAANVTSTGATITWTTDESATSVVNYGTTTSYGTTASNPSLSTSHSISLTGLQPSTTYHYRVQSADAAGNTATSTDYVFTTGGATATAPFLRSWLVVGPFSNTSRSGYNNSLIAETTVTPSAGIVSGGLAWTTHQSSGDLIDFAAIFSPNVDTLAYAHVYVNSTAARSCQLWLGSDDGVKVWVNGTLVHDNFAYRPAVTDQDRVPITLQAGWNRLLVKVDQTAGGWGLYARICDSGGNTVPGLTYSLNQPGAPPPDTTPPTVSGIFASVTSPTTTTIAWTTNEVSTSIVEYGTTTAYGAQKSDPALVTQHSISLTGLAPNTTYHYRAKSADAAGNTANSTDYVLITPALPDTTPPVISQVTGSASSATEATIAWQTDEAATSVVEYGTTTAYGAQKSDPALVTQHSVRLTGLAPGTTYHYRVKSADASGNESVSADRTFTTPAVTVAAPFLREWLLIGPFGNANRAGFDTDYIGEATGAPSVGTVSGGLTWGSHQSPIDIIDLYSRYSTNQNVLAYSHLYVNAPYDLPCMLWLGSDDGVKVWLNGTLVHENAAWRPAIKDQDKIPITLEEGWNRLLVKVDNLTEGWGLYARMCDGNGNAIPGLSYQLNNPTPTPSDSTPPAVLSARATDRYTVIVSFDELVTAATANALSNYRTTASASLRSATLQADGKTVILKTSWHRKGTYTLTVTGVSDMAGNRIPTGGAVNNTATYVIN